MYFQMAIDVYKNFNMPVQNYIHANNNEDFEIYAFTQICSKIQVSD